MSFDAFAWPAVILLGVAALFLLISHDWRLSISALGVMYVGVFVLTAFSWPLEMAVVKLVAGWISVSVLGIGLVNLPDAWYRPGRYWPSEIVFRVSIAGLVGLVAVSLTPSVQNWLSDASYEQVLGGLILVGMGILYLGLTVQPVQTVFGLLVVFAGFEILYATVESSVLVAGFLAVVNMGVALMGAYLLVAPTLEVEE